MYEHRHHPPLHRKQFLARMLVHFVAAGFVLGGSLGIGMWGYEHFEGLSWRDAYLNAAMLMGGMGPVETPRTPSGKIFAGTYALYAGVIFLLVASIILAPMVHRLLHRFHWEDARQEKRRPG